MTKVWAHRGASSTCPENTLEAFRRAVEVGADGIELDVQRTRDGRLVVIHDETLERTTSGTGRVAERTWDEVRRLDAGGGARVPLLIEALALLAPTTVELNIELKDSIEPYPGMGLAVAEAVHAFGMGSRTVVSSFNHVSLGRLARQGVDLPLGLLYVEPLWQVEHYAAAVGARALHPHVDVLREPGLVDRLHGAGLAVNTWTVDEPGQLRELYALGVDAVITNDPEQALALRR